MTRVAITGANGQVGSEISLLLREHPGIQVVPIARNPSGSAFLRSEGMACRHGRLAEQSEAAGLLGDCDVVVHFALSNSGRARADRIANRAMTRNVVLAARPGARLIFISTIMVYAPNTWHGLLPDSYGFEKLANERFFRRLARQTRRQAFVLRLGHVLGGLQNISSIISEQIGVRHLSLPFGGGRGSNTVFTATITEAIAEIAAGKVREGTYDLVTSPQWTWREVYAHYAAERGREVDIVAGEQKSRRPPLLGMGRIVRQGMGYLSRNQFLRERLTAILALAPERLTHRVHARYLQARAWREIAQLRPPPVKMDAALWRPLVPKVIPNLPAVADSLRRFPLRLVRSSHIVPAISLT